MTSSSERPGTASGGGSDLFVQLGGEHGHNTIGPGEIKSPQAKAPDWVKAMNKKYAVAAHGTRTLIAVFNADSKITFIDERGLNLREQNNFVTIESDGGSKRKRASESWLAHPDRRQYLDPGVVFLPGEFTVEVGALNLWRGWNHAPVKTPYPLIFKFLTEVVCSGNAECFAYLWRWMALGVQQLDRPIGVALVLRGPPGCGKGTFAEKIFGALFAPHFIHATSLEQLTGRFSGVPHSLCVFADEAFVSWDRKAPNVLKALITEPRLLSERKFMDPVDEPNRLRLILASNEDHIVRLGAADRRYCVLDVAGTYSVRGQHQAYWQALNREIESGGLAGLLYDLLNVALDEFNVQDFPVTSARTDQMIQSLRGVEAWVFSLLQAGWEVINGWPEGRGIVSTDILYAQYQAHSALLPDSSVFDKARWSMQFRRIVALDVHKLRTESGRERVFDLPPLDTCRKDFANTVLGDPDFEWE